MYSHLVKIRLKDTLSFLNKYNKQIEGVTMQED